jgi:hypothetical protein
MQPTSRIPVHEKSLGLNVGVGHELTPATEVSGMGLLKSLVMEMDNSQGET